VQAKLLYGEDDTSYNECREDLPTITEDTMAVTKPEQTATPLATSTAQAPPRKSTRPKATIQPPRVADVSKSKPPAAKKKLPPSARLVSEVRSRLGVTREFFARMTGFSVRAISGWEAGRPLSEPARRRVMEMKRLRDALVGGIRAEFIPKWLEIPCEGLGGLKPVEVLERGESDRLWRTVLLIGSGMPT